MEFAKFWNSDMRFHVACCACAPRQQGGARVWRPLAFESFRIYNDHHRGHLTTVVGTVHRSSMRCACSLWSNTASKHGPDEGSEVRLSLSMCANLLKDGFCPWCREEVDRGAMNSSTCCRRLQACCTCTCKHAKASGSSRPPSLEIPLMARTRARILLDAAARGVDLVSRHLGKVDELPELSRVCDQISTGARGALQAAERSGEERKHTTAVLARRDDIALDMLCDASRAYRVKRSSSNGYARISLVASDALSGTSASLSSEQKSIIDTHAALFALKPPNGKRRR